MPNKKGQKIFREQLENKGYTVKETDGKIIVSKKDKKIVVDKKTISPPPSQLTRV